MQTTMLDSVIYGSGWRSPTLAAIFDERARTRDWLEILAVLAETQAEFELIPPPSGRVIAAACRGLLVDDALLDELRRRREATSHPTAGLIAAIAARCGADGGEHGEWVYFGASVQDLHDTQMARALLAAHAHLAGRLAAVDAALTVLAARHRDTVMLGRTHGQAGLPITFGFKVAGWGAEVRRHLQRLREIAGRLGVGQLAGGVGSLASLGPSALALQARFLQRLGLHAPVVSWTASRDVLAEWGALLTLITGTADRIGHEVYNLQRGEVGELHEAQAPGAVGSITMPHKRNPERAEHLGTLARLVRHLGAALAEGLVHDHERDGRAWKVEWQALPEITLLAGRAVEILEELVPALEVDAARMRHNVEATRGGVASERLMLALARRTGRRRAHELVHGVAQAAAQRGEPFDEAARRSPELAAWLPEYVLADLLSLAPDVGQCGRMVDRYVAEHAPEPEPEPL